MRKRGLQLGVRNVNNAIHSLWSFRSDFTEYTGKCGNCFNEKSFECLIWLCLLNARPQTSM